MRIAITLSYTKEWNSIASISVPNMQSYCLKHGYSLFVTVDEYEKYNGLCKINNILRLCKGNTLDRFDYIFSFDCDTLITNHKFKLEYCIEDGKSVFVSEGGNMGVFGLGNTREGLNFIQNIKEQIILGNLNCEQDGMDIQSNEVAIFDHPAFNSYLSELYPEIPQPVTKEQGQWVPGCFVLHVPALPLEKRIEILNNVKQHIVYE